MTGFVVPVLPSVAAADEGGLFPRAVPALADRTDPRTRVSVPRDAGMKKPFRRRLGRVRWEITDDETALGSALTLPAGAVRVRATRRVIGQLNWLHPFPHHVPLRIVWQRWRDSNPRRRGFGDRRSRR